MITEALQRIYASNQRDAEALETVELSHSAFSKTFYLVQDSAPHIGQLDDGTEQVFSPFGFEIVYPSTGNQQDLAFIFDNVSRLATEELRNAIQKTAEPIKLTHRVYIKNITLQQSTPLTLSLTNISVNDTTISARATRADLIKRKFPFGANIYYDQRFKGIE